MNEVLNNFIKKLEQNKEEINFNFGIAVYNKMYERQIKRYDSYSTFSFTALKKSTFKYFDKYYSIETAQKLKLYVENDLKIKEKNTKFIRYKKHLILSGITKFIMAKLYNGYHKDIMYTKEGLQQYICNNLYEEIIDIKSCDGNIYFTNFEQLSKRIIELGYSNENLLNIILEIVKLNIERYEKIKSKKTPFYFENLKKNQFENLSKKEIKIITEKILENNCIEDENIPEDIKNEIIQYYYIRQACETIYEYYINRPQDKKDIQQLYDSLLILKIDENLCNKIAFSLKKKAKKTAIAQNNNIQFIMPKTKDNLPFITPKGSDKLSSLIQTITKKEQRKIIKELETYFDFENMKPIRLLSLNEIVYCVYLLMKNSSDTEIINNFITLSIKRLRKENPLYVYNNLYDKFKYFKDKYQIENIMESINREIEKIFICSDEEYIQIKYVMSEYIKFILNEIGNNFDYEKEEAAKIMVLNRNA